ncbi:MAG: hypothetical protein NVS1B11_32560 [Terriglobales bacterium]
MRTLSKSDRQWGAYHPLLAYNRDFDTSAVCCKNYERGQALVKKVCKIDSAARLMKDAMVWELYVLQMRLE